jgi:prevent-host-death family protein
MSTTTVGAREANQQFSKLLKEAEKGKEIAITRNGTVVARLVPARPPMTKERKKALERLVKFLEKGIPLGGGPYRREDMYDD